jgi:hypothetical protein
MIVIYRDAAINDITHTGFWYKNISPKLSEEFYIDLITTVTSPKLRTGKS